MEIDKLILSFWGNVHRRIAKIIMQLEDLHYQILKVIILTIKYRFYFNAMGKIIVISIIGIWISIWRGKMES